jgi:hypothetical protein
VSCPCILAHDLGATGNKATLFDAEGDTVVASAFEAYETAYPRPNLAEQNRATFWAGTNARVLSWHPSACALAQKQPSETIDIYEQVPYNFAQMAIQRFFATDPPADVLSISGQIPQDGSHWQRMRWSR